MAKDKPKKDKKSKAGPQKIAGLKVPKVARKQVSSLGTLFSSELGREILADALIAAAGAAAAALTRTRTAKAAGSAVASAGTDAAAKGGDAVQTAAGAVANVVSEAARAFLPPTLLGEDDNKGKKEGFSHLAGRPEAKRSRKGDKNAKASKH